MHLRAVKKLNPEKVNFEVDPPLEVTSEHKEVDNHIACIIVKRKGAVKVF